jgi:hypothetical protein
MQLVILFGMLIVDVSQVKLPVQAKQYNLPLECGQLIDGRDVANIRHVNFNDFLQVNGSLDVTHKGGYVCLIDVSTCLSYRLLT